MDSCPLASLRRDEACAYPANWRGRRNPGRARSSSVSACHVMSSPLSGPIVLMVVQQPVGRVHWLAGDFGGGTGG